MPGWHEATRAAEAKGELGVFGIVQEQHGDRARLFMQWKGMDWPIAVDSLNLLGVRVVPITLGIDRRGNIRKRFRRPDGDLEEFLSTDYSQRPAPRPAELLPGNADRQFLWSAKDQISVAIEGYEKAIAATPEDAAAHFRHGVALRRRFDSPKRQPGDFQAAVDAWSRALELDPNNYIWRRRIQQYGPRLDKPYPFYHWVARARREISARGDQPIPLVVEPRGSELAGKSSASAATNATAIATATTTDEPPDKENRVTRDDGQLVQLETTVVPHTTQKRPATRLHLSLRPDGDAHWNNEAEGLIVWLEPPPGWGVDRTLLEHPNASTEVSSEERLLEVELEQQPGETGGGQDAVTGAKLTGYALYYVCEDAAGKCLYRRQDFELELPAHE